MVVELKRPWPTTGETEVVFEPTEFLRKLATLIPPPRTHHVRYFGVFAARSRVHHQVRAPLSRRLHPPPRAVWGDPSDHGADQPTAPDASTQDEDLADAHKRRTHRIAWAMLLARVFTIDVETCPRCDGRTFAGEAHQKLGRR